MIVKFGGLAILYVARRLWLESVSRSSNEKLGIFHGIDNGINNALVATLRENWELNEGGNNWQE